MNILLTLALLAWSFILGLTFAPQSEIDMAVTGINEDQYTVDDYLMGTHTVADESTMTCSVPRSVFDLTIKVIVTDLQDEPLHFNGQWMPKSNEVYIDEYTGIEVGTVSHEVRHIVDTMMARYGITDQHFGAYLQGEYTKCVWELVENYGNDY